MIWSTIMGLMAEYVFESALVEEFYNKCHGPNGRFCSAKGGKAPANATKGYGSGKTDPKALSMTQKYGTRQAPTGKKNAPGERTPIPPKPKVKGGASVHYKADKFGSGKTDPEALRMTNKFGTRGARPAAKKKTESNIKYKKDDAGSGKTDSEALKLTEKYGARSKSTGTKKTMKVDGITVSQTKPLTQKEWKEYMNRPQKNAGTKKTMNG